MITVQSTPPLVALTGNPIRFKLRTDNHIGSQAVQSRLTLIFTAKGATNDVVNLIWGKEDIVFTCKTTPDDSGTQIPDASAAVQHNDWVALVAEALLVNYYVSRDWTIEVSGSEIRLFGMDHNIGQPFADFTWADTGNAPSFTYTYGFPESIRDFFKIGLQLFLKSGSEWIQLGEDNAPVDSSGDAGFDIHTLFADRIYSEFKFPEASNQILINRPNAIGEYKIRYFEQYGNPIIARRLAESDSFFAMVGGISHLQQAIYNRQASSYWEKLGYNQYFLTWSPKTKLIDRYTTEKLFYLVRDEISSLVLKIEINYNNSTSQTIISKVTVVSPVNKGIYEIACSPNVLQLSGYDTGTIDSYRVWMEDENADRISEIRTFNMDYQYHENVREFLFQNSLGGFDTLRITGDVEDNLEYERTSISKVLGAAFTEMDHQIAAGSVSEQKVYKANTGWISKEDASWIRDFLLSRQVYQINKGKLVPILITSAQAKLFVDREDIFSIDFEYQRAYKSSFYSKEIVTAEFGDDFNDDFANER